MSLSCAHRVVIRGMYGVRKWDRVRSKRAHWICLDWVAAWASYPAAVVLGLGDQP